MTTAMEQTMNTTTTRTYGDLHDAISGEYLRPAHQHEALCSWRAAGPQGAFHAEAPHALRCVINPAADVDLFIASLEVLGYVRSDINAVVDSLIEAGVSAEQPDDDGPLLLDADDMSVIKAQLDEASK